MGPRYLDGLKAHEAGVSRNVTWNLYERHLKPLFIGEAKPGLPEPAAPAGANA
jgi:hypothetical protein